MGQVRPILERLTASGLPPFHAFDCEFRRRINLITGDNGLGKSLLLDLAFWQLTNTWPSAAPLRASGNEAYVESVVTGEAVDGVHRRANFDKSGSSNLSERGAAFSQFLLDLLVPTFFVLAFCRPHDIRSCQR